MQGGFTPHLKIANIPGTLPWIKRKEAYKRDSESLFPLNLASSFIKEKISTENRHLLRTCKILWQCQGLLCEKKILR